ncbi:hypothetical protein DFH05DRAFT_805300 [Lentinula detonsa]|uniref:Uncharacterized protein n=1 Tax=Lentinula detonsa TaxID=2804962 RepID=A0A9W8U006_9AGAR|nr:hypothetical protein DFH05DRAFT_805300 [Lentinula detonsa]
MHSIFCSRSFVHNSRVLLLPRFNGAFLGFLSFLVLFYKSRRLMRNIPVLCRVLPKKKEEKTNKVPRLSFPAGKSFSCLQSFCPHDSPPKPVDVYQCASTCQFTSSVLSARCHTMPYTQLRSLTSVNPRAHSPSTPSLSLTPSTRFASHTSLTKTTRTITVSIEFKQPHARLLHPLDENPYTPPTLGKPHQPPELTLSERIQKLIEPYVQDRMCNSHVVVKLKYNNAFQSNGDRKDKRIGMYFWGVGGDCVYEDLTGKSKRCEAHLDDRKSYDVLGGYILERTGAKWAQQGEGKPSCLIM